MAPPKLRHLLDSLLTPGERIGSVQIRGAEKKLLIAGKGTYVRQVSRCTAYFFRGYAHAHVEYLTRLTIFVY